MPLKTNLISSVASRLINSVAMPASSYARMEAKEGEGGEGKPPMKGGPGDEGKGSGDNGKSQAASDAGKDKPKTVTVNYGGKTFKTDPETAAIIVQQQRDLEAARKKPAPVRTQSDDDPPARKPAKKQADDADDDAELDDLMFSNPKEYRRRERERMKNEIQGEMRAATAVQQRQQNFWANFIKSNPDLEDDRDIAENLFNRHFSEWSSEGITLEEASKRLADKTRDRLDAIAGRRSDPSSRKKKKVSEGGESHTDRNSRKSKERERDDDSDNDSGDDDEAPRQTTAQILAARKKARQQINQGATKH